nr:hypothetical protein [Tanacetum cinerariifolium]
MVLNSPCLTDKKELPIPGQTTTSKELSNSLMASSLPKTTLPTKLTSAKVKTVNDEVRIQALVDGKRVNIKESSFRHTLRLDDAEATSCLTNIEIFKGLAIIGAKTTSWNEFSSTMAPTIICLATNLKFTFSRIEKLEGRVERLEEENKMLKELKSVHSIDDADEPVMEKEKSSKQERKITDIDADVEINLEKAQAEAYNLDLDPQEKVLSMMDVNEEVHVDVEEVLEVVKATKLMTKVVTTARATKVSVPRKRKGVIIQDPEETTTKATMQPKLGEEVTRQLEAELNAHINWNVVIEQVKRNERLNDAVMKYQTLKRKPLTQAQAIRNMIVYLKNMDGFKMYYFKGMTYDEIRHLFEKHYNFNQTFLNEVNEGFKVSKAEVRQEKDVEVEISKRECESLEQEIAKKQKMEEETEELKKHLQIVTDVDDDDDVYTDATSLASKIPIVNYKIHTERNRPYFKIIRADGNHMLFISLSIMLKNFDREDLES